MKRSLLLGVFLGAAVSWGQGVRRVGESWELENGALAVTVHAESGWMKVLEKQSGTLWQQDDPESRRGQGDQVRARRAPTGMRIDGDPAEWAFVPQAEYVWLPWKGDNGESNCSGGAKILWDTEMLYLYVRVRDDRVAFGGDATTEWWEADSVEFWVDSVQVGLHLAPPGREVAVNARGEVFAGSQVGLRPVTEGTLPGYEIEVAMPLRHFPVLAGIGEGLRFSFAIGLNDADPGEGEPVRRARQSYYPASWIHSAPATFALAVLTDSGGEAPARSRENDRSATALDGRVSDMTAGPEAGSLTYRYSLLRGQAAEVTFRVVLQLVGEEPFLDVRLDCPAGAETPLRPFHYPWPLRPPEPQTYFVGVADYSNGRYLPVGDSYLRNRSFVEGGGDLPFVLVTDGTRGLCVIMLTPWDAAIQTQTRPGDAEPLAFPGLRWLPQKGAWGAGERHARLAFFPSGGHVAACKLYRSVAAEQGLLRTFAEKEKAKPNVRKLFGAVNWWGAPGLSFAREATGAGMTRGLLNGRPSPPDMAEIVRLGWLVGEYDNYEDIDDSETIARAKAPVKEHAVVKADGELMTAWITRDKDMQPVHTYMKQCTGMMTHCARIIIPKVLETYPYNTRFLDVTTATGLKECYSPVHPTTRAQDQRNREALCAYVGDELGLVAGGEHGRYWDVRHLDYHEGMMGGGMYTWPAGYLRDVTSREEIGERYLKYGIDPSHRAPLFELVFHDCVVNYWYWGACNDYLHQVAPELTDRKTAMNVLYGTPPMMWANAHGLRWQVPEERAKMIEIYRNTCKLHEVLADQEMMSHEFLTPDRQVQRTVFRDGTVCTVNFGAEAFSVADMPGTRGKAVLRCNDFLVKGPVVEQWRLTSAGESASVETYIRTPSCLFVDAAGRSFDVGPVRGRGRVWVTRGSPDRLQISLDGPARVEIDLAAWQTAWAGQPVALFETDASGDPIRRRPVAGNNVLDLAAGEGTVTLLALVGKEARRPDLGLRDLRLECSGRPVSATTELPADAVLDVSVHVRNEGLGEAPGFALALHLDSALGPVLARRAYDGLAPGAGGDVKLSLPAGRADGERRIVALLEGGDALSQAGRRRLEAPFRGPFRAELFPHRRPLLVVLPPGDAAGMPVELAFAPGAADPDNLRVVFEAGGIADAQFEPKEGDPAAGTLVFALPRGLGTGPQRAAVVGLPAGSDAVWPRTSRFEIAEDGSRLRFDTYAAAVHNGVLGPVAVRTEDGGEHRVLSQIIVSSKETGWSSEEGEVRAFALRHRGPVRAVFACTKEVIGKYPVTREWRFYGDRMEVRTSAGAPAGCRTRAFYTANATATNANGATAAMDGAGEGEGFGFQGRPQWYALFAETWRNACLALTPSTGFTYWDSGAHRGQISLDTAGEEIEARVYLWGPGAPDDAFARAAAEAYAAGIRAEWVAP
ncbi:MAG: hypothetical protein JXR77_14715 [Lentisphaeria bacterium]|nr:hypothetical protein [Lentisphaeria bacterium]